MQIPCKCSLNRPYCILILALLCQFVGQIFAQPTHTHTDTHIDMGYIAAHAVQCTWSSVCAGSACQTVLQLLQPATYRHSPLRVVNTFCHLSSVPLYPSLSLNWRSQSALSCKSRILCANSTPNGAASACRFYSISVPPTESQLRSPQ